MNTFTDSFKVSQRVRTPEGYLEAPSHVHQSGHCGVPSLCP